MTLSKGARLVLIELNAPPATPISAAGLREFLVVFSTAQIGAWLRELRTAGLAEPLDARSGEPLDRVPSGMRSLWRPIRNENTR